MPAGPARPSPKGRLPGVLGRVGLFVLWMKAMSFSAIVWTLGFCFFLMGAVLPWKPWPAINWVLIGIGCTVFFAAFKLDRLIWRRYAQARAILRQASASREMEIRHDPDLDC